MARLKSIFDYPLKDIESKTKEGVVVENINK